MESKFLTDLETKVLDDDKFELIQPLIYFSERLNRAITVPRGFVTDFASVPRVPVAYLLAGGEADKPAVIHDYLYHSHEVARAVADDVFLEAMALTGQPWWRRNLMWLGVRLFGGAPYDADHLEPDQEPKGESQ